MISLSEMIEAVRVSRHKAREYPIYRIFERVVRVGVWFFAITIVENYTTNLPEVAKMAAALALDKMKNEYRIAFEDYDLGLLESIKSLFQRD